MIEQYICPKAEHCPAKNDMSGHHCFPHEYRSSCDVASLKCPECTPVESPTVEEDHTMSKRQSTSQATPAPTLSVGEGTRTSADGSLKVGTPIDSQEDDPVNRSTPDVFECIEITEHMNFCIGNAMKHLWRAGHKKDALEDLECAEWYIKREIQRLIRTSVSTGLKQD